MTDGTLPTAPDPDLTTDPETAEPVDPDTAEPAEEAPDPDQQTDPGTPGVAEQVTTIPSVSPTAAYGGPALPDLHGTGAAPDEQPTNVERD